MTISRRADRHKTVDGHDYLHTSRQALHPTVGRTSQA